MAEKRQKIASILLRTAGKRPVLKTFELFAATDWPGEQGAAAGRYRVRMGGKWLTLAGRKYTFLTLPDIGDALGAGLAGLLGQELAPVAGPPEQLRKGARVRARNGRVLAGQPLYDITILASDPLQDQAGQWWVLVHLFRRGLQLVPVEDVEVI
ncbi:MAG: hypothetical protein AB7E47_12935 [Desulfovibrionaceae bacterium]